MMENFLSRYRPQYFRSIAYLLQASEYRIHDYLAWFRNVGDFSAVEKRKVLVRTPKAIVVLVLLWAMAGMFLVLAIWIFLFLAPPYNFVFALLFAAVFPYLLAYGIIVPLFMVQFFIQRPIEHLITWRAGKALRRHPAIKIAIAGSFGKTSMREMLGTILAEGKKVALPPHSYNTPLGISAFIKTLTGKEDVIIFELGEYYPGDIRKLCNLTQPDIGIITGVNEAHLEKFKTLDLTAQTIFELAEHFDAMPKDQSGVLSDRRLYVNEESELAKQHAAPTHILYNRHGVGVWHVANAMTDLEGTSFVLGDESINVEIHSELLGLHQVGPLAAAAHLAMRLGLSPAQVEAGAAKTKPFDHRLEKNVDAHGVITLDDSYNGNPDGVAAVIAFLGSLTGHRRFYVTPGLVEMGSATKTVHQKIGEKLAEAGIEKGNPSQPK